MAKKVTSLKFKKEHNLVMTILEEYFDKSDIDQIDNICEECDKECKDDNAMMLVIPLGFVKYEKGDWIISYDITFISENPTWVTGISLMVSDFWSSGIELKTTDHHVSVYNKNDECIGTLYESQILDFADEAGIDYDEAIKILSKEKIKEDTKESKNKEKVH